MNTFSTIHTKFQGETIFCFVCIATFFGYILGVNKVIECVIAKHSNSNNTIKLYNKYTQTNLNDLAEYLTSNNVIIEQIEKYSNNVQNGDIGDSNGGVMKEKTYHYDNQDVEQPQEQSQEQPQDQSQEHLQTSPKTANSDASGSVHSSNSNSEEDYEVVKKNENTGVSKNKIKFFEWFSIL
jgi:hypothetical protein